jgi:DNA-3-methyladenine glycosylase
MNILPPSFYARNTALVARELLGARLVCKQDNEILSGIIVETEAYGGLDDQACHAFRGNTPRTAPLYGPVGHAYVYFIYGNHFCVNLVARTKDTLFGGVLIRAVEPIENIDLMRKRRNVNDDILVTNGPGKLTQAFGITRTYSGINVTDKESGLYVLEDRVIGLRDIVTTTRIGISKSQEKLYRFYIKNNSWVSKY